MNFKLAGYETKPRKRFQQELMDYSAQVAAGDLDGVPPMAATPVYASDEGQHFVAMPTDDGLMSLPFIPGSAAEGEKGGFVPIDSLPSARPDDLASLMAGAGAAIDPQSAASWLGGAATNAALGGAPGTPLASVMASLGMPNPMASGVVGGAVAAAANLAGLGSAGSLLGSALAGGPQGLANALGSQALSGLLNGTNAGSIPGVGVLGGIAGGQLSNLANSLTDGGWGAGLDQATNALGDLLGGGGAPDAGLGDMANSFVEGGCTDVPGMGNSATMPDLNAIGAQALEGAADKLLDQWQVDDESSAAEHVAHKLVNDNRDVLKAAAQDPQGLIDRIQGLFCGVSSSAVLPAARLKDPDVTKPEVVALGVATILAEGQPISRINDPLAPSGALILEGSATVLSAGLPTARVTSKTDSPGVMIEMGGPTVLVGGPSLVVDPPARPPTADPPSNGGPADTEAPEKPSSGSQGDGGEGDGGNETANNGDSTTASPDGEAGPGQDTSSPDSTQSEQTEQSEPSQQSEPALPGANEGEDKGEEKGDAPASSNSLVSDETAADPEQPSNLNAVDEDDTIVLHGGNEEGAVSERGAAEALAERRNADNETFQSNADLSDYEKVVINAHGTSDPDGDGDLDITVRNPDGSLTRYDARQLKDYLRNQGYQGSDIELVVCNSGSQRGSHDPYAQDLARELGNGAEVTAYPHNVHVDQNSGRVTEYHPYLGGGIIPSSPVVCTENSCQSKSATPREYAPPPRSYKLPGETSPRNSQLPEAPGNIIYH